MGSRMRYSSLGSLLLWAFGWLILFYPQVAYAVPAARIVEQVTQPDGQAIWVRQFGDERANGLETVDGYTILQDPPTGYWVYAQEVAGKGLRPSALVVGRDLPAGIQKGLRLAPSSSLSSLRLSAPFLAEGAESGPPSLGSQPVLVLFVDFTPSVRVGTTAPSWNSRLFGVSGSVKKYYEEVSYGAFTVAPATESNTDVSGSVDDGIVSVTLSYPHPDSGDGTDDRNRQIVRDALIAANPYVNFATFDTNHDGIISPSELHLVVIVAGYEASYASSRCGPSVWGHRWGLGGSVPAPILDGTQVGGAYTQVGEWHCSSYSPPGHQATIGILAHELGHDLGLPDLYDTDLSSVGIGKWGVMGHGSWNSVSLPGDSPAHMDPWSKLYEGWVTPTLVTGSLINETISPAATTADVYQLLSGTATSGEYFLVENRQQTGFDAGLPGVGLIIWHIDPSKSTNTEECYPEGPSCATYHYKVAVVQADGLCHLEMGTGYGDSGDPWPGSTGKPAFNDGSSPNSRRYDGTASGVSITDISPNGATITATLRLLQVFGLSVIRAGAGSGTVTSSPIGIDCGATCDTSFSEGTTVTLTATAAAGSIFAGWSGEGCSGTETCTVTMTQARNVTATFSLETFMLTVTKAGTGSGAVTSVPAGINCGSACSAPFDADAPVTLTAMADAASTFDHWSGDCAGQSSPCSLSMNGSKSVTAIFNPGLVATTITTNPASRQISVDGQTYVAPQTFNWLAGTTHTLGAPSPQSGSPGTRYVFQSWNDGGGQTHSIAVPSSATTYTVNFTTQYKLTIHLPLGFGTVMPIPTGSPDPDPVICVQVVGQDCPVAYYYASGTPVQLTATANPGYVFSGWSGDCAGQGNPCFLSMNGPRSVTATFGPTKPDLVVTALSNPPASAAAGNSFPVTDTTKNQGNGGAGASTTRYHLSLDAVKGSGDVLLSGSRAVPALAPQATSTGAVTVTVPASTAGGLYYLLGCADDTNVVKESNETNNCRPSTTRVTITKPTVSLTAVAPIAAETPLTPGVLRISRTGPSNAPLTVTYTVTGTATKGTDYTALPASVTIAAGASAWDVLVTPIDDTVVETPETVVLTLAANAAYTVGTSKSATVTILDADIAGEWNGSVTGSVTCYYDGIPDDPIPISGSASTTISQNGNSIGWSIPFQGTLYPRSGTIRERNIDVSGLFALPLVPGVIITENKYRAQGLLSVDGNTINLSGSGVVRGTYEGISIYCTGTDTTVMKRVRSTVTIAATDPTAVEGTADPATLRVARTTSTTRPLTVFYTVSGSATPGLDYATLPGSVTFPTGAAAVSITVLPIKDSLVEGNETVTVTLSARSRYILGAQKSATATILGP